MSPRYLVFHKQLPYSSLGLMKERYIGMRNLGSLQRVELIMFVAMALQVLAVLLMWSWNFKFLLTVIPRSEWDFAKGTGAPLIL